MKNYELKLPDNYREAFVVDATDKKLAVTLNVVNLIIAAAVILISWLLIRPQNLMESLSLSDYLIFMGCLLCYLVLHELVHGAAYKLLTRQKLTFGLTLSVAYCGVPDIYVYRRASMISLLAPFCVFTVVFGVAVFLMPTPQEQFCAAILLALHWGGCVGDLYDTFLYLTRFRSPLTLMRDTGPKQTFYLPQES